MTTTSRAYSFFSLAGAALLSAFVVAGCGKKEAGVGVPAPKRSPHFDPVCEHVDIGGTVFAYVDIDHDVTKMAAKGDQLIAKLRDASPEEIPAEIINKINLEEMIVDLGIDRLAAIAASSVKDGDRYLNKAILYTPGGRDGLFKLMGGTAEPFTSVKMAPADADLVLERDLNLKAAVDIGKKMAARFPSGTATFTEAMQQNVANLSMTVGDFLGKFDTKIIVIGRIDAEKKLQLPMAPVELPELDLMIALHNVPWLWEEIKKQMPPNGQSPVEFTEGDGFEAYLAPDMLGNPRLRPQLYFDKGRSLILIGTSAEFIADCLTPTSTIESNADFKVATTGLPMEGNGLSYMSPDVIGLAMDVLESSAGMSQAMSGTTDPNAALGFEMIEMFMPRHPQGIAGVSVNLDQGMLVTSNAYESHKTTLMSATNPMTLGVLASMALPAFNKIQENAKTTTQISNTRQVVLACRMYAADNEGKFPESLNKLVPDYIDPDGEGLLRDSLTGEPLEYNTGLTDTDHSRIWLIATPVVDGERVVGYVGGMAHSIDDDEFTADQEAANNR